MRGSLAAIAVPNPPAQPTSRPRMRNHCFIYPASRIACGYCGTFGGFRAVMSPYLSQPRPGH